jgi:hypothetical protein
VSRRNWKLAIALKTLVELLRRHPGLRLAELHPGGGQYDTLGLWRPGDLHVLCQFNMAGSSLLLSPFSTPRAQQDAPVWWGETLWRYPAVWQEFDLVPLLEARLGLPAKPPAPARPTTVALGVIAELAARHALSERLLELRAGWHDSAGAEGSHLRAWCPKREGLGTWQDQARWGTRFWSIGCPGTTPGLVLDLSTGALDDGPDLWSAYQKGTGVRELAWQVEAAWRAC